jgi:hypothetical protein
LLSVVWLGFGRLFGQCATLGYEGRRPGLFRQFAGLGRQGLYRLFRQCAAFRHQGLRSGLLGELAGLGR